MADRSLIAPSVRFVRRQPLLATGMCVAVLAAITALLYVAHQRAAARQLVRCRHELHSKMDADTTVAYRDVLRMAGPMVHAGSADALIEEMVAYAATILAIEHQDESSLEISRTLLRKRGEDSAAGGALGAEGYLTAARILANYGDGDLTEGLALAESVRGISEGLVMARLEGLRLMVAAKIESPKIAATASDLGASVNDEVRALSFLGMWHLSQGNTAQGDAYFKRAQNKSPNHPQVLLGLQWVRLFAPHPPPQDVWQAQQVAEQVLRLPAPALTPPVRATALLLRSQASLLEGDAPRAERDRAEALGLDPTNLLHEAAHDGPARP